MTFDHILNWNTHLKNLKITAYNNIKIMKTLSVYLGFRKNSLITINKATILAKLGYGAVVYNTAKNNILKILNPIYNKGIRLAIGAFHISPTTSIICNTGELPLEIRRIKETLKFVSKSHNHIFQAPDRRFQNIRNSHNTSSTINEIHKTISDQTKSKPLIFNKIAFPSFPLWMWNIKSNTELLKFKKKKNSPKSTVQKLFFRKIFPSYKNLYRYLKISQ